MITFAKGGAINPRSQDRLPDLLVSRLSSIVNNPCSFPSLSAPLHAALQPGVQASIWRSTVGVILAKAQRLHLAIPETQH
jgi:hypothetical protein